MTHFYSSGTFSLRFTFFAIFLWLSLTVQGQQKANERPFPKDKGDDAIAGQYIVVYKNNEDSNTRVSAITGFEARQQFMLQQANATLRKNKIFDKKILQVYGSALKGFTVNGLTGEELNRLRKDDQIEYIEADKLVHLDNVKTAEPMAVVSGCSGPVIEFGSQNHVAGTASFGSVATVTGVAVIASGNGCTPLADMSGKIAVIDRGACGFAAKALSSQTAGAIGVIIVNNAAGSAPGMAGADNSITIPAMSLSQSDGNALKTLINNGPTTVTLYHAIPTGAGPQCTPWGITRVAGGLPAPSGRRAWIVDSGIELTHPDLNVSTTFGAFFAGTSKNDENGHGTHVAGTIGAKDNGFGVVGVAAGAEVVPVRVFDATGIGSVSAIISGINYTLSNASSNDVANLSLGGSPSYAMETAIQNLALACKVVIAAGNDGKNANFASPARVNGPRIYTVSAMDINNAFASFSNFGNAPVDYAAPGVSVASCWLNGTYAYQDGTSMAAPHVTGLLLLGSICGTTRVTGDPDGKPDLIARRFIAAENTDDDHDTFSKCSGDLDDFDASVYPGAPELCDGKDNNCDGQIDEGTVCCPAGNSNILYVKANASGTNAGTSWTNAFTSLQSALNTAKYCGRITQIWVANGTYVPTVDALGNATPPDPRTKTFQMKNGLAIYGGFTGNEAADFNLALRDLSTNRPVLSGALNNVQANNVYNVVLNLPLAGQGISKTAILDGFTIANGNANLMAGANLVFPFSFGGGMMNYGSDVTVKNCTFFLNYAQIGGAISNQTSSPSLINSSFLGNVGQTQGGALNNSFSSPKFVNCSFKQNFSDFGAGMLNGGTSNPSLLNCTFSLNGGSTYAQAIINFLGSSVVSKNSIFWGNGQEILSEDANAATVSYSIVKGGWTGPGSNNSSADPQFDPQSVLSLLACSPAINAGDPNTTTADPSANTGNAGSLDAAFHNRIFGGRIDMGAYEFQGTAVPFSVSISANPGLTVSPGSSTTLTASGADTYLWSTTETTAAIVVSPSQSTDYSVTGTTGSCSMVVTATVHAGALPVSLVSFSAKKQPNGSVKLDWITTNETDNAHFLLERSKDLRNIEAIAKVNPDPSLVETHSYSYSDELPYQGTSYYRLKQVDLNGHTTSYAWVAIVIDQAYMVFPNPVVHSEFKLTLDEPENAIISFYDVDGRIIPLQTANRGASALELKLPKNAQPGIYVLKVEERGMIRNYRIVVE